MFKGPATTEMGATYFPQETFVTTEPNGWNASELSVPSSRERLELSR